MKYAMFAAVAAATLAIPAVSAGAQGMYVRATPVMGVCVANRDRCEDSRDVRRVRYDVRRDDRRDDRAIVLQQERIRQEERIRAEERAAELARMNRGRIVVRDQRVNASYGQRVANGELHVIFGPHGW